MSSFWMLLMSLVVFASLGWSSGARAGDAPDVLVHKTSEAMLAKLRAEKEVIAADPKRVYDLVHEIIVPHFDMVYMSRLVLAKHWRQASKSQRAAFVEEFKTLLVRTYASSLSQYSDQKLNYLPFRQKEGSKQVIVKTEVAQPGGLPIPIDYRLHLKGEDWKVFDVVIDGISLVTNYRTSFSREIRQDGIDKLVSTLAERNRQGKNEKL